MTEIYNKARAITKEEEAYIKAFFSYDPISGIISRTDCPKAKGSYDKDGYLILKIRQKQYKSHRIAWFLHYGCFPTMEIDHINHNRSDNRISNLREVSRGGNVKNVRVTPNPLTGVIGVYVDRCTKGLKKVYTTRFLGKTYRFHTLSEAIKFRKKNGYAV